MTVPSGFTLVLPEDLHQTLFAHLFPGDRDEHGAVIAASVVTGPRGTRLLAKDLFLAKDGADYLPGERGYRMLTAAFITDKILYCRDEQLCYLAVHNHGGHASVAFSEDDLASHERGYPALSKLSRGQIVGGLAFTTGAVAGDLWIPGGERRALDGARLLGPSVRHLSSRPAASLATDPRYDRQARLFGKNGQQLLGKLKVGVIGAGGAGSLIVEYLSRLGIGHLVVADFDRVDISNVPRITGATFADAQPLLTATNRPAWIQRLGARLADGSPSSKRRSRLD